ncbi:MAG: DUF475 domain-containing protein [Gaiellaceae bacterium]
MTETGLKLRAGVGQLRWQLGAAAAAVVAGYAYDGARGASAVAVLSLFETSLSFDNAIVNAQVMARMSAFWKRIFLVLGVPIATVGMRFAFPILIVALTSHLGAVTVLRLALKDPTAYQHHLHEASVAINTLGGTFLLLVFLDFFLRPDEGRRPWVGPIERALARFGRIEAFAVAIALVVVYADAQAVAPRSREVMLVSGLIAVVVHVVANGTATALSAVGKTVRHAGLATFLYLEILDASFSFDGVIGAFAISDQVVIICLGLGVGALFVRTLTCYFDRTGTLVRYVYLGNGAHWAVGTLAAILFVRNSFDVPEPLTASIGLAIIVAAFLSSIRARDGSAASDSLNVTTTPIAP